VAVLESYDVIALPKIFIEDYVSRVVLYNWNEWKLPNIGTVFLATVHEDKEMPVLGPKMYVLLELTVSDDSHMKKFMIMHKSLFMNLGFVILGAISSKAILSLIWKGVVVHLVSFVLTQELAILTGCLYYLGRELTISRKCISLLLTFTVEINGLGCCQW
jgi:hypothetical protein